MVMTLDKRVTEGDSEPGDVMLVNAEDSSTVYLKDYLSGASSQWLIVVLLRHFA
jgi:hypothetical protein